MRFEPAPGRQVQVDFGEFRVPIAGVIGRTFLFVATLGHSRRRLFVRVFRHERQSAWLEGIEGAFRHFGGVPEEVLIDNARALVTHHDAAAQEVVLSERFRAFATYCGVRPLACAPYRARTKNNDERGVGYIKRNAIAGHHFGNWVELDAHWCAGCARWRIRGSMAPLERPRWRGSCLTRSGYCALWDGRPSFRQLRELSRIVQTDGCIELGTSR